jgi:hypothetical protein
MRPGKVLNQQQNVKMRQEPIGANGHQKIVPPYSTLPIFFTAAISRALSAATNSENAGAS